MPPQYRAVSEPEGHFLSQKLHKKTKRKRKRRTRRKEMRDKREEERQRRYRADIAMAFVLKIWAICGMFRNCSL